MRTGPGMDGKKQHHDTDGKGKLLGKNLACPPCNIGPRSTPNYDDLADAAMHHLPSGETVFAGQRNDGFFVDLGAIFDLADIRELQEHHLIMSAAGTSVDPLEDAEHPHDRDQGPDLDAVAGRLRAERRDGRQVRARRSGAVRAAARCRSAMTTATGRREAARGCRSRASATRSSTRSSSRSGTRTAGTRLDPINDDQFVKYFKQPELSQKLTILYPGVFPNLAAYTKDRADLEAILLTGIPSGIVSGFQNFTTSKPSDMLRLNVAIPPTTSNPNALGVVGGDLAGYPNGRRVFDDVVSIELKAFAGATIPLVDPSYSVDGAVGLVSSYLEPGTGPLPVELPLPRHAPRRIRHAIVVTPNPHHSKDPRPEHVMLDLGPGVGALVLHTGADLHGVEIEVSPAGRDGERSHKQVHERPVAGRPLYGAVFDVSARRRVHALARRPAAAA